MKIWLSLSLSLPASLLPPLPPALPAARRGAQTPVPARRPARDAGQGEAVGETRAKEGKGKGSLPARGDSRWHRPAPAAQAPEPAAARRLLPVSAPSSRCRLPAARARRGCGALLEGEGLAWGCPRLLATALSSCRRVAGLFGNGRVCVSSGPFGLLRKPDLFVFT